MMTMQDNPLSENNPLADAETSGHARLTFNAVLRACAILMSICAVCLSGCSGFPTDGLAGDPLSDRPILPPETSPAVQAEANAGIDKLAQMVGATAKDTVEESAEDALAAAATQDVQTPEFRFSTELPAEPDFDDIVTAADNTSLVAQAIAESDAQPTSPPEAVIRLVAATEPIESVPPELTTPPIEAELAIEPLPLPTQSSSLVKQPLKPIITNIANAKTIPDSASIEEIKFAAQPKPLSAADLRELTRPAIETFSMASAPSIDLSKLELESSLTKKPTPPTPEPPQKTLTAAEHLSETIRLIEETVSNADAAGERHGAEPGLRLLEMLRQKMDQVSSANWRLSGEEHQYWQQQLEAVSVMFAANPTATTDSVSTRPQTATQAIEHLELAASHLRSMAGLKLRGGQLCSQIFGFGKFDPFQSNQFKPGNRALIYVEVENQSSQEISGEAPTESGSEPTWQTRLQASYVVVDSAQQIVHQETYPVIEDIARRHRRDFYVHLPLTIAELSPGDYQMMVTMEDLGNANTATLPAIDFSVVPASN